MNYDHAFHAGNPGDVLKHALLVGVIDELQRRDGPLAYIDTHAGAGLFGLADSTGEWTQGIGRLTSGSVRRRLPELRRYLELVVPEGGALERYPGSPLIAQVLLGPRDTLHLFELNPRDHAALTENLEVEEDRRIHLEARDGYEGLLRVRRPDGDRLIVLVDPPFEVLDEWDRLEDAVARFTEKRPNAAVIVWYPTKDAAPHAGRPEQLVARLSAREGRGLAVELRPRGGLLRPRRDMPKPRGALTGTGLLAVNCPPRALARFAAALPELARALARPEERSAFEVVLRGWG